MGAALSGAGADAIAEVLAGRRAAIITDDTVAPLHAAPLAARLGVPAADLLAIPAGEASKTRDEWTRLTDALLTRGFGRDSVIIAVGGGVVGDLAGFVAATYMRGVSVVQVPTTLLAMVDASVGGKTGIDTAAGKNLVGAFHHPTLVVADPETLATLPDAQLRNGLAEALKHALITSLAEVSWLVDQAPRFAPGMTTGSDETRRVLGELVDRNIRIKAAIVARDEREAGPRKLLNFGHTIGHALELASGYAMLHGECVAVGMRVEAMIAASLGIAPPTLVGEVTAALRALSLPLRPSVHVAIDDIVGATRSDKKARGGVVEYALLAHIGRAANAHAGYGTPVAETIAANALTQALNG